MRFSTGMVAGFLLVPVSAAAVLALLAVVLLVGELRERPSQDAPSSYAIAGASLPVKDGGRVVWARADEVTHQTCRGACDDLLFAYVPARVVEIRASDGRMLLDRELPWPLRLAFSKTRAEVVSFKRTPGVPS